MLSQIIDSAAWVKISLFLRLSNLLLWVDYILSFIHPSVDTQAVSVLVTVDVLYSNEHGGTTTLSLRTYGLLKPGMSSQTSHHHSTEEQWSAEQPQIQHPVLLLL